MPRFAGLAAVALFSLFGPTLLAQPPERNAEVLETFRVYGDGDDLIVPVTIQGKTYPFVLDTGATRTVYDASLRHLLGRFQGVTSVEGLEKSASMRFYTAPEAFLGKLPLPRDVAFGTDLSVLRHISGEDIRGVLGMDFLHRYIVRIDFDHGTLTIQSTLGREGGTPFPLFIDKELQTPRIHVDVIGSGPLEPFVVDTGYSRTAGSLQAALFDLLVSLGKLHEDGETRLGSFGFEGRMKNGCLARLNLGPMEHRQLLFSRSAGESSFGLDFLKRYQVTLDFPGSRIYLRKGKRFDAVDQKDRSGLHFLRPAKETVVQHVDAESAGAKAGIQPGDVLVSVAGLQAGESRLFVLRERLTHANEKVPVTLKRDGRLLKVVLKLE